MNNECSPEEVDEIVSWLTANENQLLSANLIRSEIENPISSDSEKIDEDLKARLEKRLQQILDAEGSVFLPPKESIIRRYRWWAVAASLILLLGLTAYFMFRSDKTGRDQEQPVLAKNVNDPAPGKDGAILTLGDGRQIVLDSLGNGVIATQGNVEVKLNDGRIEYDETTAANNSTAISYNSISTPRGRQYQVVLPDGTRVWLNAASSLSYPTAFTGNERKVSITGEAYFAVAKDRNKPFRVKINDSTEVEVLGTEFNANAYQDESAISITLLEGSLNVWHNAEKELLKPGQQARIVNGLKISDEVDLAQVTAWKDGRFEFGESTDIKAIMRQISRWYDVDIEFRENFNQSFGGNISRHVNISRVLEKMEMTGRVHFTIEDRKVIVSR